MKASFYFWADDLAVFSSGLLSVNLRTESTHRKGNPISVIISASVVGEFDVRI